MNSCFEADGILTSQVESEVFLSCIDQLSPDFLDDVLLWGACYGNFKTYWQSLAKRRTSSASSTEVICLVLAIRPLIVLSRIMDTVY